jgi:hypothetical protein
VIARIGEHVWALALAAACTLPAIVPALAAAGGQHDPASPVLACAESRNPTLKAYTFNLDVAMRMRHFPWLRFRMAGSGQYVRGHAYSVTFTQRPAFAKAFGNIDLSALDPSMWSHYYTIQFAGSQAGSSTFILRPRQVDAQQTDPLREAVVSLDSAYATRSVVMHYADGEIQLVVTPAPVQGYSLPVASDVTIDMPGHDLAAEAAFSDYSITPRASQAGAVALRNWHQCMKEPIVARAPWIRN